MSSDKPPFPTIPVKALPLTPAPAPWPEPSARPSSLPLLDQRQRPLRDLRISVTDRCNFRCSYCMPREAFGPNHTFLPQSALLTFEEIQRLARVFASLGVRKLRLTGGEPLLRRGIDELVQQLSTVRSPDGQPLELAMTTNGVLLARMARRLREAGLNRITVSLDALDPTLFKQMADVDTDVKQVLHGIDEALAAGLAPLKVNMVVQRGVNDSQILPMVRHFKDRPVELRFIEYMDVGQTNQWRLEEVLPWQAIHALIHAHHPLQALAPREPGETARRWRHTNAPGHIGFIASVTQAFCGACTRLRLSTEGRLYTCLFAEHGADVRTLIRDAGMSDDEIAARLTALWQRRTDRYSELRQQHAADAPRAGQRIEMSYIGG